MLFRSGFVEAFANIYLEFARAVREQAAGKTSATYDFPNVSDGLREVAFVKAAWDSQRSRTEKWLPFPA